VKTNFYDEK